MTPAAGWCWQNTFRSVPPRRMIESLLWRPQISEMGTWGLPSMGPVLSSPGVVDSWSSRGPILTFPPKALVTWPSRSKKKKKKTTTRSHTAKMTKAVATVVMNCEKNTKNPHGVLSIIPCKLRMGDRWHMFLTQSSCTAALSHSRGRGNILRPCCPTGVS